MTKIYVFKNISSKTLKAGYINCYYKAVSYFLNIKNKKSCKFKNSLQW